MSFDLGLRKHIWFPKGEIEKGKKKNHRYRHCELLTGGCCSFKAEVFQNMNCGKIFFFQVCFVQNYGQKIYGTVKSTRLIETFVITFPIMGPVM